MNIMRNGSLPWIAVMTVGAFTSSQLGCQTPDDTETPDREITTEVLAPGEDDSGKIALRSFGEEKTELGKFAWPNRTLIVDGRTTTNIADIYGGTEIVVPLNDGYRATLRRTGNLFEVQGEIRPMSTSVVQLRGFAIKDGAVELFRADNMDNANPNVVLRIKGIDDLASIQSAVAASLAMAAFLATVEDGESAIPVAVVLAIVAAIMAAAWLAACYLSFRDCLNHCKAGRGADHKCGFAKVKVRGKKVDVDWSLGFGCRCY